MLDPEQMTLMQWFWIVFAMVLAIFFACRCVDLNTPIGPVGLSQSALGVACLRMPD